MGLLLFSAFIIVPLVEVGLFIKVGGAIGFWPTILVVISTAVAGTALLRHQGLGALNRLQDSLSKGEALSGPLFDGFCLLAAGALLLTPGFFTDTMGFLLFIPPIRRALGHLFTQRMRAHYTRSQHTAQDGIIIEGEWKDITTTSTRLDVGSKTDLDAPNDHSD